MKIVRAKKVVLATLMALLIVLCEGCKATNATLKSDSASTVESNTKGDSASTVESNTKGDSATTVENSTKSDSTSTVEDSTKNDSASTVENRIKTALTEKTTDLFVIGSEFVFEPGATGSTDSIINGETFKTVKSTSGAQNQLKTDSNGYIIRIDEGQSSMEDSNNYKCTLEPLPNNEGVSLTITSTQKNFTNTISGTIKGNTLTASHSADYFVYLSSNKSGFGYDCSGKYSVNMLEIEKSKWPPLPVKLSVSTNYDNYSRILTWEDKNQAGIVKCYDIYRCLAGEDKATKVATVSNCSTWTDTSSEVKSEIEFPTYYIVTSNAADIKSPDSNHVTS